MSIEANHSKTELTNSTQATYRNESPSITTLLGQMPWQKVVIVSIFVFLVLITVIGNTLVITSVLTTRKLRTVTNFYVMNLAVTDWLVGTCVMPPSILNYIYGAWKFNRILCNIWISLDVLLCTASILSLCAISLDRYLAVIQPLKYSKKRRSKRLALFMIFVVWVIAFLITCPPLFGWYNSDEDKAQIDCRYNQNKGYVVFSAMGSFFIPLSVMLYVYLRIGFVLTSRQQRMVRDALSEKSNVSFSGRARQEKYKSNPPIQPLLNESKPCNLTKSSSAGQMTSYKLVELPSFPATKRCTISCGSNCSQSTNVTHFPECSTPFAESCLSNKNKDDLSGNTTLHNHRISQNSSLRVPMRVSTCRKETKTTKTLTTVMGGFIACWLPFFCYYLSKPFLPEEAKSDGLMIFLTWVGWINCAINPFIYASYNPDFRSAFWRLTFKNLCSRKPI